MTFDLVEVNRAMALKAEDVRKKMEADDEAFKAFMMVLNKSEKYNKISYGTFFNLGFITTMFYVYENVKYDVMAFAYLICDNFDENRNIVNHIRSVYERVGVSETHSAELIKYYPCAIMNHMIFHKNKDICLYVVQNIMNSEKNMFRLGIPKSKNDILNLYSYPGLGGPHAIAIGANAGNQIQGPHAIAIGMNAGNQMQGPHAIAIRATGLSGMNTIATGLSGMNAIAIGLSGMNAIAIGPIGPFGGYYG